MTLVFAIMFLGALAFWAILWKLITWGMNALHSKIERTRR